jgi:glyoxylase-like metal-dependent hydrolase (beta-lactamase superfamily II)
MYFRQIQDPATASLCYLLADRQSGEAVAIDPLPSHALLLLAILQEQALTLRHLLRTHVHPGRQYESPLLGLPGLVVGQGEAALCAPADRHFADGDEVGFGAESVRILATPGHTPGCVSYLWRDRLFCGDVMEINGCGQPVDETDPGAMYDSVTGRIFTLPDETLLFPAHDYRGRTVSTVAEERRMNTSFSGLSREAFVTDMGKRTRS